MKYNREDYCVVCGQYNKWYMKRHGSKFNICEKCANEYSKNIRQKLKEQGHFLFAEEEVN